MFYLYSFTFEIILADRVAHIRKARRPDEERATGVVVWDVEVNNQNDETVAVYDILTLVERADD